MELFPTLNALYDFIFVKTHQTVYLRVNFTVISLNSCIFLHFHNKTFLK